MQQVVSVLCELQKLEEKIEERREKKKNHLEEHKANESTEVFWGLKASVCGLLNKGWTDSKL